VPTLTAGGSGKTNIYNDLGDGVIYGSRVYANADDYLHRTIDLNAAAISALTAKSGQAFALGGLLTTLDTIDNSESVFGFSNPVPGDVQLILNMGSTLPVITLASNYSGVSENGKTNLLYTFTRTQETTNSLTVNFTLNGTATRGNDYNAYGGVFISPTTGNVVFSAGQTTAQVEIVTIGDTIKEADENIVFTLATGNGYTIGTPNAVITTILNDDGVLNQQGTTGNDVMDAGTTRTLTGRAGNDILTGSNSGDVLVGGVGSDLINSGLGFDTIAYSFANEGGDTVTDFDVSQDTIQVSAAGFGGGLTPGESISADQFVLGTTATTGSHRFIFDKPTGKLYFDVDGSNSSIATLLVTLSTGLNLTEDNIFAA
jgi:Ca2+-binding RTX toxin-like protein